MLFIVQVHQQVSIIRGVFRTQSNIVDGRLGSKYASVNSTNFLQNLKQKDVQMKKLKRSSITNNVNL